MTRTAGIGLALVLFTGCHGRDAATSTPTPAPSPAGDAIAKAEPIAVWMDVDPAVMRGGHEPDDGLALLQAFHSRELAVKGVSVVFGNSPLDTGYPIGQEIVRRFGPPGLRVFRGAASGDELGTETDASRALADALRESPLTILALGPVTNVATVLKNHPKLARQVKELVSVAGRRPGQSFVLGKGGTPFMDFNFELDPEGFQILLDSGIPIVLAPFEISSKTVLTEAEVERFATVPQVADFFLEPLRDYVSWYDERFGIRGIYPFDTLAVAYLTSPEWIEREELPVAIETHPDDIHPDREKPYLLASREIDSRHRAVYCHTASPDFVPDLMRRLLAE
jgi:inosine-uridine nucleoside N-ribohydrolase